MSNADLRSTTGGSGGAVDSVNGQTGVVVLDTGDISSVVDSRYVTDAQLVVIGDTSGINTGDQDLSGYVPYTGATTDVDLGTNDLTAFKITASPTGNNDGIIANGSGSGAGINITHAGSGTKLEIATTGAGDLISAGSFVVTNTGSVSAANLSGTNTGDQTSIVGITGTMAEFNSAVTDGNILFNNEQGLGFRFENRTSDPGSPTVGQVWLRTDL
jgi:hypothetical protein